MSTIGESASTGAVEPGPRSEMALRDVAAISLLAAPGFVLPPLLGPSAETVALTVTTTAAAVAWALRGARRSR